MCLLEAKKGQTVIIKGFQHKSEAIALLMGLGLLPGDQVQIVAPSVFGSPVTILKGENTLAMRTQQAKLIEIDLV